MARLLALIACIMVSSAVAQVGIGGNAPHFTLSDVNGAEFSTETSRTEPLVVIFTNKDLGDESMAWRDSLLARRADTKIVTVLDLDDVPRMLRSVARRRIAEKGSVAVLDWDGKVSKAWRGADRSQIVVMVVGPGNTVARSAIGNLSPENLDVIDGQVRSMSGATDQ